MTLTRSENSPTLLIVDDTPTNLQVLFDLLQSQNYRVAIANDGETALSRLEVISPDLILLDVMMPGIDGFETCDRIKENPKTKDIPIIFMTALSHTEDKVKGLSLGAVDYITKPFQHEEVLARIRVQLQLQHLNRSLTLRIAERDQSLQALKQAQSKLVQSEKMSSLGQLVAGIAHEINNPINFVHGNAIHVAQYCQDLVALVKLYQQEYPHPTSAIQTQSHSMELDFVCEDVSKLTSSMQSGTERVKQLVLSLRNFSRLDESDYKVVNIHEGINSTLLLLTHRLKSGGDQPNIEIIRDFADLAPIGCYPSQLNQVMMNLINNAIDAIRIAEPSKPTITIRTDLITDATSKQWMQIAIADNGIGILETHRANLFDPFFTTKPIGEGTGLGLSISHQVITEAHGGKIECHSSVGEGSEFVVKIPVT